MRLLKRCQSKAWCRNCLYEVQEYNIYSLEMSLVPLSVCLSICLSITHLYIDSHTHTHIYEARMCLNEWSCVCIYLCMNISVYLYLSIPVSVCQSLYLSVGLCQSVSVSVLISLSFHLTWSLFPSCPLLPFCSYLDLLCSLLWHN